MGIGIWQLILILLIVFLIFGAGRIPRIMNDLAKGIKSFKSSMEEKKPKKKTPMKKRTATKKKK